MDHAKEYYTYKVFRNGNVMKKSGKGFIKPYKEISGYMSVTLMINGFRKRIYVHRLVAMVYLDNAKTLPSINHKDGNKSNNNIDNLEWVTQSDNLKHAIKTGLLKTVFSPDNQPKIRKHISVDQFTKDGVFIKKHHSIVGASRETGIRAQNINATCVGRGKSAGGFIWKYSDKKLKKVSLK